MYYKIEHPPVPKFRAYLESATFEVVTEARLTDDPATSPQYAGQISILV